MRSPSVSISATSTPSSEVPLISPIAFTAPKPQPLFLYAGPVTPAAQTMRPAVRDPAMSAYKSDFLNILAERGFIHQVSEPDTLDARALAGAITGYIGFDCTAASLHVGSMLPIMMLYWMQQTGHRPIALMGGGTTRVGDPSGKDESRRILTDDDRAEPHGHPRDLFKIP